MMVRVVLSDRPEMANFHGGMMRGIVCHIIKYVAGDDASKD